MIIFVNTQFADPTFVDATFAKTQLAKPHCTTVTIAKITFENLFCKTRCANITFATTVNAYMTLAIPR